MLVTFDMGDGGATSGYFVIGHGTFKCLNEVSSPHHQLWRLADHVTALTTCRRPGDLRPELADSIWLSG